MERRNHFIDIFNELLEEKGLTRKAFSLQSGIPYPTVIGWTNLQRLPDFTALVKIADFFECSVDYLTGRQNELGAPIGQTLSPTEEGLLSGFRALNAEERMLILKLMKSLSKQEK